MNDSLDHLKTSAMKGPTMFPSSYAAAASKLEQMYNAGTINLRDPATVPSMVEDFALALDASPSRLYAAAAYCMDGLADGSFSCDILARFVADYAASLAPLPKGGRRGVVILQGIAYPAEQQAHDGNFRKRSTRFFRRGEWSEWCKDDHDVFTPYAVGK